jgi:prepilin-type N-terminal cleavage/methylation domain-containing protein
MIPFEDHRLQQGFTLVELVIVIVILGILAAVAVPRFSDMAQSSRVSATRSEMDALKKALVGNPAVVAGGRYVDCGFEGDVGFLPSTLTDLVVRPDSIQPYDQLTGRGWNGPYIDSSGSDYLTDAWGSAYSYQPGLRRIVSTGGDTLVVTF